jgi:nucleotide-binding universal stress UspA family protein
MSTTSGQERIVVGIDGSPEATAALSWAIDEARLRGVGLRVIHVFPALISLVGTIAHEYWPQVAKEQEAMFDQVMAAAPAMDDLDVERSLIHGNPAEVLVESSRGANLLVIGYRGRGGFRGMLLGSVSTHCVHQAHCPVVVIRQERYDN